MDDYNIDSLNECRNEWTARLVNILVPQLNEGINSIFNESYQMCKANDELEKYLMTFQNLLSRVPSWNQNIIDDESKRIIERSNCSYLNDLLTCVHVTQLKILTNVRVCKNQKKIDIDIPKIEKFIHRTYIAIARKLYKNIYLFEQECSPLTKQKNNRELELIIRECILNTIRETIPIDKILRAYMSEKMEEEVLVEEEEKSASKDLSNNETEVKKEATLEERITIAKDEAPESQTTTSITPTLNPLDKIETLTNENTNNEFQDTEKEETVIDFTNTEDKTSLTPSTPPSNVPPPPVPIKNFEPSNTITDEMKEDVVKELDNLVSDDTLKIGSDNLDLAELEIDNFDLNDNTIMKLND